MKDRQKLFSHALMVVAPLLMVFALTAAWFISSISTQVAPMSFASKSTGPGAVLYRAAEVTGRVYDKATLSATVKWGPYTKPEGSDITVKNMLPGQCEYYLLVSDNPTAVFVSAVSLLDGAGVAPSPVSGKTIPLAQCVGVYLLPITITPGAVIEGTTTPTSLTLTRDAVTGQLAAAIFRDLPPDPTKPISPATPTNAYVLAVFCDPVYQQGKDFAPVNTLAGSLGFSMSFTGGG